MKTYDKGDIVILTVEMPIPCPGAPGKFTVMLDDYFRYMRGEDIRKNIKISFFWPIKLIGLQAYDANVSKVLDAKNIDIMKGI